MTKQLLIYTLIFTFALSLVSCGNGRHSERKNRQSNDIYTEPYYSDNSTQKSLKNSSSVEPDSRQIKLDLAGKTIVEPTHKLYRSKFEIRSTNNVLNVDIQSTERNDNQTVYKTRLTLSDNINIYNADVDITYAKSDDKWAIQHLESKYLEIVPTGKFNNCIIVKKEPRGFSEYLYWYNNCDVALVVEGRIFAWTRDGMKKEWQDFADIVPANGKAEFYYETNADYEITRIERP